MVDTAESFYRTPFAQVILNSRSIDLSFTLTQLRGESCGIIILRGFMLGGILLGVPIFAFFSILVNPHQSQVFVRELPGYWDHRGPIFPQNPIIKFVRL
jgi:hypothetical protein